MFNPNKNKLSRISLLLTTAALGLVSTPAWAQDPTDEVPDTAAEEDGSSGLGVILVTARKRSENLQQTPIAITAMTGEMLEEKQIANVSDVARFAPNVNISPVANLSGSSASITAFIRGVGQTDFNITVDPGVGVYVDGVYVARSVGALLDMADVESIQVLRGPQGTLFGKNTIGGAIVVNSVEPQYDFDLKLEAATGRFNRADIRGMINVPLSDTLAIRAVASYETRDGYQERLFDGDYQGDKDSFGGRLALRWEPTPDFTVNLSGDINIRREGVTPSSLINLFDSPDLLQIVEINDRVVAFPSATYAWNKLRGGAGFCGADGELAPVDDPRCATTQWITDDIDETWSNGTNQSDFDLWGVNMTLDYDFGDVSLKSISAYRDQKSEIFWDFDLTPHPYLQSTNDIDLWQASQELQLTGSLFDDRLQFAVGAYYLKEKGQDFNELLFGFADFISGGKIDNDSYAGYFQFTYEVTDRFSVTPGIRYTEETKRFDPSFQTIFNDYTAGLPLPYPDGIFIAFSQCIVGQPEPILITDPTNPLFGFPPPGGCVPTDVNPGGNHNLPAVEVSTEAKEWTPALTLDYEVSNDVLVYASYSKGFKNGGFTQRVFPGEVEAPEFTPEFVESYEVGAKTELFNSNVRLNMAAFQSDYTDIQVVVNEGIAPKARNAGTGRIRGFEVEGDVAPSDWLRLTFGVGYLDAFYRSIDPNAFPITVDSKFAFVPEWTASAAFNADIYDGSKGRLAARGDWSYQSGTFKDAINSPELYQPGFSVFGASLAYTEPNEHFVVTAGVTNLTDERYILGGFVDRFVAGTALANYSRPREWFLKLAYQY